ncbi:2OG-Fe(II) oxygenase [Candidimonas nitroreducens]|uniref:Proline hydroxylase n=1 Tax=Candidimonas nitroreducens TaxID=683354 RepID=A0A225N210_9BURK|nr:2OG-Fe(II) oxygenase [Candidimonas nitroreducens]OWT65891.1 proline hydroxylase [Candidimonas nitroreducens]
MSLHRQSAIDFRFPSAGPTTAGLAQDWDGIERSLDESGLALLPGLLNRAQCEALAALYAQEDGYRARIVMARHGFGRGEYKYFAYPLPPLVDSLRVALYPRLAPIANRWRRQLGSDVRYPAGLDDFLAQCHEAGQTRPTPLILEYRKGDYNCLHQDLYGEHVFPLQVVILLSEPGKDFSGGEFVMTETSGSGQRAEVIPLRQGDAAVFSVHRRPAPGKRGGIRKAEMRHGVSLLRSGTRHTVGLIFHDAR